MNFKLELVTSRPVAERILERANIERIKVEKKLGTGILRSFYSSQSLSDKLKDKAEWESSLAKATSDVNNLPEGPAREKAKVDQLEFQWRLGKMALDQDAEKPEDVVFSELEKSVAMAGLPKIEQFISELTTHMDSLT